MRKSSIPEPNPSSARKRCRNVVPVRGFPTRTMGRLARALARRGKNRWSRAMAIATTVRTIPNTTAMNRGITLTPKVRRNTRYTAPILESMLFMGSSGGAELRLEGRREAIELLGRQVVDSSRRPAAASGGESATERLGRYRRLARHAHGNQAAARRLGRHDGHRAAGVRLGEIVGERAAGPPRPRLVGQHEEDGPRRPPRWL